VERCLHVSETTSNKHIKTMTHRKPCSCLCIYDKA